MRKVKDLQLHFLKRHKESPIWDLGVKAKLPSIMSPIINWISPYLLGVRKGAIFPGARNGVWGY